MRHVSGGAATAVRAGDPATGATGPATGPATGRRAGPAATGPGATRSRLEGLDGLRAVAIVGVLAVHLGFGTGGFLGVQVFFVVSGFLITTLLVGERRRAGRTDLRAFYLRRFARLTPGLLVSLAVVIPVWVLATEFPVRGALVTCLTAVTYLTNWAGTLHNSPLPGPSYTWSLAQEEQFYLVIPVLVARLRPARYGVVARWCVAGSLALGAARIGLQAAFPDAGWSIYHNPVLNMDCLLMGVGLALWLARPTLVSRAQPVSRAHRDHTGPSARVLALPAVVVLMAVTPTFGPWAGAAVLAVSLLTVCVIVEVTTRGVRGVAGVLDWAPVRWVGTRSYSIYLFNVPALLLFDALRYEHWLLYGVLTVALTLAVSEAVTRWVETPAREAMKARLAVRRIPAPRRAAPVPEPAA